MCYKERRKSEIVERVARDKASGSGNNVTRGTRSDVERGPGSTGCSLNALVVIKSNFLIARIYIILESRSGDEGTCRDLFRQGVIVVGKARRRRRVDGDGDAKVEERKGAKGERSEWKWREMV